MVVRALVVWYSKQNRARKAKLILEYMDRHSLGSVIFVGSRGAVGDGLGDC